MSDERLPEQPDRRFSSSEKVRLPDQTGVDRRAATRYQLTLGVRYLVLNRHNGVVATGVGQTVDLSSCGVRFTTDSVLESGLRVKLLIDWPALLDGAVELQLTMSGTQAQMRHADPQTTLKYYQQSIPESVKSAAVALEAEILKKAKAPAKVKASAKPIR